MEGAPKVTLDVTLGEDVFVLLLLELPLELPLVLPLVVLPLVLPIAVPFPEDDEPPALEPDVLDSEVLEADVLLLEMLLEVLATLLKLDEELESGRATELELVALWAEVTELLEVE